MMQIVPKWRVYIQFADESKNLTLWIHDNYASNVLRKVADLDFSSDGLQQPTCITVGYQKA